VDGGSLALTPEVRRLANGPDPCAEAMGNASSQGRHNTTTTFRYAIRGEGHCLLGLELLPPLRQVCTTSGAVACGQRESDWNLPTSRPFLSSNY
jgi:hypothetical protein